MTGIQLNWGECVYKLPSGSVTAVFFKGPLDGQTRLVPAAWKAIRYVGFGGVAIPEHDDVVEFVPVRAPRRETDPMPELITPSAPVVYDRMEWEPGFERDGVPYLLHDRPDSSRKVPPYPYPRLNG